MTLKFWVVLGLLKLRYSPNQAAKDSAFHFGGALPIIDYIGCSKYDDVYEDYIVSGNSIGELCTLTGRPYDCTIVAEIPSQAFLLTHEAMRAAMDKYNDPTQG